MVKAGVLERLNTIPALTGKCYGYEPTSIDPPTCYVLLDGYQRALAGQITTMTYRLLARTCIRWQDNEQAELELDAYANSVPAAIDTDPQLAARLQKGVAKVTSAQAVFVSIGGTLYRALDTTIEVLEKDTFGSGI